MISSIIKYFLLFIFLGGDILMLSRLLPVDNVYVRIKMKREIFQLATYSC